MSAAYVVAGLCIGTAFSRASGFEPAWAVLLIPGAICLIVGWAMEQARGQS